MSKADISSSNLLVQATSEHHSLLAQNRQDIHRCHTLGQLDGCHGVGLVFRLLCKLVQAKLGHCTLHPLRRSTVGSKALRERLSRNLRQGRMQSPNKLSCWRGEVRWFPGLVVLHNGKPVGHGSVVAARPSGAVLEAIHRAARAHHDTETGWAANGLLAGGEDDIQTPFVKGDFLASNTAHAVDDDEGVGAHTVNEFGHGLDVAENTGGGVNMCDGDDLVVCEFQSLLNVLERRALANWSLQLCSFSTVGFKTGGKGVGEVSAMKDEGFLAGLDEVGGNEIPAEGAGTCENERLGGGRGALEELANQGQGFAESLNERWADMALTLTLSSQCHFGVYHQFESRKRTQSGTLS